MQQSLSPQPRVRLWNASAISICLALIFFSCEATNSDARAATSSTQTQALAMQPAYDAPDSLGLPLDLARLDWAQLAHYADANAALPPVDPGQPRVVFMGNSITEGWAYNYPQLFAAHPAWVNRGISGQTTEQMLVRFRPDVLALNPKVIVIAAGINDIAGNTGYMSEEDTYGNIVSMAELARANGIAVVIESVLPAWDFPWRPGLAPAQKVVSLNRRLAAFAKTAGHVYLDGFSALADDRPGIRKGLTTDEVHLTPEGYAVLAPLVEAAVARVLQE